MIRSMTGYGSAKGSADGLEFSVELKSVNNRYLDVNVRLPRGYIFAEDMVKTVVGRYIQRGKTDVFIGIDSVLSDEMTVRVNQNAAESFVRAVRELSERFDISDGLTALDLVRFPDVTRIEKREEDRESVAEGIERVLEAALAEFNAMREREGQNMCADVLRHLDELERLLAMVEERSPRTVAEHRERLEQRMREVLESRDIELSRIVTEAAIFAERVSVAEETARLHSHIDQMRGMLEGDSPIGRKLDFLTQELNREANTIGAKGNDAEMSRITVEIKSEVEKIREQIQNIE